MPLRVAAISFLNPAPLLYHFEHEPEATQLRRRYEVRYTTPAQCAAQLHAGQADLGLIPIAELTDDLSVVPGCAIASLEEVRSILLLVRHAPGQGTPEALRAIRSIAADNASRSSSAYVRTILGKFYGVQPPMVQYHADPETMLQTEDAALLIGDPALLAREHQEQIERAVLADGKRLLWLDVARLWREHTGLPWVAAVWAVRPGSLGAEVSAAQLIGDLTASREAGQQHIEELVAEWVTRMPLPAAVIRHYLTRDIYYRLDENCLRAMQTFRNLAAEQGVLAPLPALHLLQT